MHQLFHFNTDLFRHSAFFIVCFKFDHGLLCLSASVFLLVRGTCLREWEAPKHTCKIRFQIQYFYTYKSLHVYM